MEQGALFEIGEVSAGVAGEASERGAPRLRRADRSQIELRPLDLESLLAPDHEARAIWAVVSRLDLGSFLKDIRSCQGVAGRPATDPAILLTLWLYANSQGVGSARELAELCKRHDAYRWICGGVEMNHHTLSDFRVDHGQALDELLTQVLGVMAADGLVSLSRVAQDGTRVRASAGAGSFRREERLEQWLVVAREQVEEVKKLAEDPTVTSRERKAAERAARERGERLEQAVEELKKIQATKASAEEQRKVRVSITDPEARVMKMGDGGFRPAYNVEFASTTVEKVIVGVEVTNVGSDCNETKPMLEQIEQRLGEKPKEVLVDGGYAPRQTVDELGGDVGSAEVTLYAPVAPSKDPTRDRYTPRDGDSPQVAAWRERMGTEQAKEIYKERAATAEWVNATVKCKQAFELNVRGLRKVKQLAILAALAHNVMRWITLTSNAGGVV
jgi:transposase